MIQPTPTPGAAEPSAPDRKHGRVTDVSQKALIEKLTRSKIFRDYEQAFRGATGLPLAFTPVEIWGLPLHGDENENPFCRAIAESSKVCASCLEMQGRLAEKGITEPVTLHCFAGLCDTAVPVHLGERVLGFLRTGQVFTDAPTVENFDRAAKELLKFGAAVDLKKFRDAYFAGRVLTSEQYQSMVRLLKVFAEHLGAVSNQVLLREEHADSPMVARAKDFIERSHADDLSLPQVSRAVNTSTFYFCKMFKKATGLTFTEYLGRVRIEKARELLLNPHARISEIAFDIGFQSLSQFNRVFKRITGLSPTEYRERLPRASSAAPSRR